MAPPAHDLNPNENNAHMIYIPAGVFGFLCPLFVGLRTWARLRQGGKMGADDYTIIAALFCCLISSGVMIASCQFGFGRHYALIEPDDKYETLKFFYLCQISYKASINLTKCSILLLYLRLFERVQWLRWTCWALIACVAMYCTASVIVTIFQCIPIKKSFDKTIEGYCIDNGQFWYANAGFSIATDIIIYLLPMPPVYQLQVPWEQRIALMMVFAMGGFIIVTSCLRVTTIDVVSTTTDLTYDISSTMWTIIEPNVAVICACMPMIRPLVVKAFPKLTSKKSPEKNMWSGRTYAGGSNATDGSQGKGRDDWLELGPRRSDEVQLAAVDRVVTRGSDATCVGGNASPY